VREGNNVVAVAWQTLKGLAIQPAEVLDQRLLGRRFIPSLALGMISYYWSMLQASEILLPPARGGHAFFLVNFPVSLGRMVLTVLLIHLACRLVIRTRERWWVLLTVWGYTQLPWIVLTALAGVFLATLSIAAGTDVGLFWVFIIVGIALFLSLWGLMLKLQALKVCYDLNGTHLFGVIALALMLNGSLVWAERLFLTERAVVPQSAFDAMDLKADISLVGRKHFPLPFDTLTYHLRSPQRGEVVGFLPPGRENLMALGSGFRLRFLGRIVGLPGEMVEVRQGRVFIEEQELSEPYRKGSRAISMPSTKLPPGHYLILGDDRSLPQVDYGGGVVPQQRIRGRLTEVGRMKWRFLVGQWQW
jgi:signal peptidase I